MHHRLDDTTELRLLEGADAPALFALVDGNRAHLRAWLPWVDANRTEAHSLAFIRAGREAEASQQGFSLGVWHRGDLAGVVGFHPPSWANRHVSLGYWLGEGFQGLGLMTRACAALTDHAFDTWRLNRVEIAAAVGNARSRAVPERLGFQLEGVRRQAEWLYDHFVDIATYAMLAEDWRRGG
jgi:ribosomal-protein-serine acetyltransferase